MTQTFTEYFNSAVAEVKQEASTGRVSFRAQVAEANHVNQNNRYYPLEVLRPAFESSILDPANMYGNLDHPSPGMTPSISDIAVKWNKFEWDGPKLYGEGETVDTAKGRDLKGAILSGFPIGFSTRASGNSEPRKINGRPVEYITSLGAPVVDAVSRPSVARATILSVKQEQKIKEDRNVTDAEYLEELKKLYKENTDRAIAEAKEAKEALAAANAKLEEAHKATAKVTAELAVMTEGKAGAEKLLVEYRTKESVALVEGKIDSLTAGHPLAATIKAHAIKSGATLESVGPLVESLKALLEAAGTKTTTAQPKGSFTNSQDVLDPLEEARSTTSVDASPTIVDKFFAESGLNVA